MTQSDESPAIVANFPKELGAYIVVAITGNSQFESRLLFDKSFLMIP